MHQTLQPAQPSHTPSSSARPLWAAVGVLGIAVAVLGGVVMGMNLRDGAPADAAASTVGVSTLAPSALDASSSPAKAAHATVPVAVQAPVRSAQAEPGRAVVAPVHSAQAEPARAVAAPVRSSAPDRQPVEMARCDDCATVLSVTAVQQPGQANGVGAVAGAVAGGVVGNQVGGGSGRAVATVLGALGGGWAGNAVEKRVRQTTQYAVRVRMDDGRVRTLEQAEPVAVGSTVVVQGGVARLASNPGRSIASQG